MTLRRTTGVQSIMFAIFITFLASVDTAAAQTHSGKFLLKTNLIYDAAITPNIGVEYSFGKGYSVAANWIYAWWKADPDSWYHRTYGGDIEIRKWLGSKPFSKEDPVTAFKGWHVGIYGQMAQYDFEWGGKGDLADTWGFGGGAAIGWAKPVGKKLSLDFTLGIGYLGGEYEEYRPIDGCYVWQATKKRRWIGPTKAEVTLMWHIGKNNNTGK